MPLFMDRHDFDPATGVPTPEQLADAHRKDVEVQARYGVRYISYWFDPKHPYIFCLAEAPDAEAANRVHEEAHGLTASKIMEVDPVVVEQFLGRVEEAPVGEPRVANGIRTIMVTDIEGSTDLVSRIGDDRAIRAIREHEGVIQSCLRESSGRLVKGLGDGVLASFESVVRGVECAIDIQRQIDERFAARDVPIRVRVGLSAGEPVAENNDLYGTAVTMAARICGVCEPGGVLASSAVKDLAQGKGFSWEGQGEVLLKGFSEPSALYRLVLPDR